MITGTEYELLLNQRLNQASDAFIQLKDLSEKISRQNREVSRRQSVTDMVLDHVPAVIFLVDAERNRITWINSRVKAMLGYTVEQAETGGTKFLRELLPSDDFRQLQQATEFFEKRKGDEFKTVLHMRDAFGEEHKMNTTFAPAERLDKNKIKSFICIALDVTRQTETQQELKQLLRQMTTDSDSDSVVRSITRREYDILRLIAKEFSTKQIAEELNISVPTVETHRRNLLRKVGVKNTAGLVRFAVEQMIV